jgi:DNA-binding transcriptional regulator YdaS (Cro superfamily)
MRMTPERHRALIQKAIDVVGSQGKLAKLLGIKQQGVSYFLHKADKVTGEMAVAIEKATNGKVTRSQLRPDLFHGFKKTPGKQRTAHPGAAGEGQPVPPATPSPV